jgi:predicted transcriptional regulator
MQCTIELDPEQAEALERLAAEEQRSVTELVQRAVRDYLARRRALADWGRRWDALVADVRSRMPPGVTSEEIEADITANFEEYLAEAAARRGMAADAGGR